MEPTITFYRLKRAIEKNTECFICDLEAEIESRYMDVYLSELVMDSAARQRIIESRGFCNHHFYKMLAEAFKPATSDGHGMALILQSVAGQLIQDLTKQTNQRNHRFDEMLVDVKKCPACMHIAGYVNTYIEETASRLVGDDEFLATFSSSKGICIPHFIKLVDVLGTVEDKNLKCINKIAEIEKSNLQRLKADLEEYIKRQSYEYSEEDRSALAKTVPLSIEKIAGRKGLLK
ncbi:MAG: DUF6062 family protein [Candidatus Bathyarchaeota archaeon]|nr:DUF6062 family protein [Candidatus Bathyarchaeota archaeon]